MPKTGTKTAVLKPDGTIGAMLWAAHYYDYLGRVVQTTKENYFSGAALTNNHDVIQNTYNFDNTLATTTRFHLVAAVQTLKIADTYYYDQVGRKTQTWEAITVGSNPSPPGTLLSRTDYNEVGQVTAKHLHQNGSGTFLQDINYAYNERGWLIRINNPSAVTATQVFGERLQYNTGATPQFNGNISGISWQTNVPAGLGLLQTQQSYTYNYDPLNRLTLASYSAPGAAGKFNEQLAYDYMGNITTLKRTNSTTAGVYLNNFTYNYTSGGVGNLLWSVTDAGTAAQNGSYTYDLNGNAASDTRNQLTNIKYNLLNLPATVTRTPGNMSYTYDAAGSKLEKVSGGITRDYVDGIEYNNGTVEFITTEEGRAIPSGSTYVYQYYLKDQLGNTRAAINQDGSIIQVQDYYAFGLEMNPGNSLISSPPNQYKYNGKETQPETGDIDYGARFYDPVIGRWNTIDPLAEMSRTWSPYKYGFDNPMRFTDPDGMMEYGHEETDEERKIREHFHYIGASAGGSSIGPPPPDWVYNNKTREVRDDPNVHKASDVKPGETYIGKTGKYTATNGSDVILNANGRWEYDLSGMTYNWGPNDSWRPDPSMKNLGQLGDDIAIGYTLIVGGGLGSIASAGATLATEGSGLAGTAADEGSEGTAESVFTVTKEGVVLPKGANIPDEFIENPYRSSNYGLIEDGKYVEKVRIDPETPPGMKGPNVSHFHLNGGRHIFDATKWPWF